MSLSTQLAEAVGGPPDPRKVTGRETAGQLDWNLKGLTLGAVTWKALRKLMADMKNERATKQDIQDAIEDLEFDIKKGIVKKRQVKKARGAIEYLQNVGKDMK